MFGVFYMLTNLLTITASSIKRSIDNIYFKEQGWERYNNQTDQGKHIYYDAEGKKRDLTTDHIMFTYRKNGDLFIEDTKTFQVRNLSEENRADIIRNIKRTNPSIMAIFYKNWNHTNSELKDGEWGISGRVFKDVNTGELYFERYITWQENDLSKPGICGDFQDGYFYLRISDGKIISISDKQAEKDKGNNIHVDYSNFINFFNTEQEKGGFVVRNRNKFAKSKEDYYLGNENVYNK